MGALETSKECSPPRIGPAKVDQASVGDREKPAPKSLLVPFKPRQAGRRIKPYLGRKVVPLRRRLRSQIAKEAWVELTIKRSDSPLGSGPRRRKDARKWLVNSHRAGTNGLTH